MIPKFSEFDELFRSDKAIWLKMLGGAAVAGMLAVVSVVKSHQRRAANEGIGTAAETFIVLGATALGSIIVLALCLKDIVRRRLDNGQKVNRILKLYLGMRWVSLAMWFFTITALTVAIIAFTF